MILLTIAMLEDEFRLHAENQVHPPLNANHLSTMSAVGTDAPKK